MARESLAIMQLCPTPLSTAFFGQKNVDAIQKRLATIVFKKTGHKISRQSDAEVIGVMRGVYEGYSNNAGGSAEITRLNDIVMEILVDQVVAGVQAYVTYVKDASTMPEPLARGTFASIKGERALEYRVGLK